MRLDAASVVAGVNLVRVDLGAKAVAEYRDGNSLLPHTAMCDKTITRRIKIEQRGG
jgi:hypothetical protein